jgi:hypothetical protein
MLLAMVDSCYSYGFRKIPDRSLLHMHEDIAESDGLLGRLHSAVREIAAFATTARTCVHMSLVRHCDHTSALLGWRKAKQ